MRKAIAFFLILLAMLLGMSFPAYSAEADAEMKSETASIVRLEKTEGEVNVTDSAGMDLTLKDRMRLFGGNHVAAARESYAWFSLDDDKSAKLDAVSRAEVRKDNKKLEVLLEEGNLFFYVDKALEPDESYHIRTSNMVMGIRGTCGIVNKISPTHSRLTVLEGVVECLVGNPATGVQKRVTLTAGERADFYIFPEGEKETEESCEILRSAPKEKDIEGFAVLEICVTEGLADAIYEASGLDLRDVTEEEAKQRVVEDQEKLSPALNEIDQKIAAQNQGAAVIPLWPAASARAASTADIAVSAAASNAGTSASKKDRPDTGSGNSHNTGSNTNGNARTGASANAAAGSQASKAATAASTVTNLRSTGSSTGLTSATGATSVSLASTAASSARSSEETEATSRGRSSQGTAEADESDPSGYSVIVADGISHGKVTVNKKIAAPGSTIKITVSAEDGYRLTMLSAQSEAAESSNEIFYFDIHSGDGSGTYRMGMGWKETVVIHARFE